MIDVHTHLWLGREGSCREAILKAFGRYGYERAWVSTLRSAIPDEGEITACNAATLDFMRAEPRIRGWCYLNPAHENALGVLERGIRDGFGGVKLWIATLCDDRRVDRIAEFCTIRGLPVLIHALDKTVGQQQYESRGMNVRNLALRFPALKIVMAHMGGNEYTGIKPIIDCPNVSVDICGVMYRADAVEYAIERLGVHRLMYGTDMSSDVPFWQVIGRVNTLPADCRERIFRRNAEEFGL